MMFMISCLKKVCQHAFLGPITTSNVNGLNKSSHILGENRCHENLPFPFK